MIAYSEQNLFAIVLVHKIDRFARNIYDSTVYKRELKKNGVTAYSVDKIEISWTYHPDKGLEVLYTLK